MHIIVQDKKNLTFYLRTLPLMYLADSMRKGHIYTNNLQNIKDNVKRLFKYMNLLINSMHFKAFLFRTEQETECQTVNDREDFY